MLQQSLIHRTAQLLQDSAICRLTSFCDLPCRLSFPHSAFYPPFRRPFRIFWIPRSAILHFTNSCQFAPGRFAPKTLHPLDVFNAYPSNTLYILSVTSHLSPMSIHPTNSPLFDTTNSPHYRSTGCDY